MLQLLISLMDNPDHRDFVIDLYNEYKERMYYYAYSILHDEYLAEDAVNQAFVGIVQNVERIYALDVSKIKPYVVISVRNACFNILKKRKRQQGELLTDKIDDGIFDDMADTVLDACLADELAAAIGELPQNYLRVILLRYFFGYSYKEIASYMNVSDKQVSVMLCRAKAMLKKIIAAGGDDNE